MAGGLRGLFKGRRLERIAEPPFGKARQKGLVLHSHRKNVSPRDKIHRKNAAENQRRFYVLFFKRLFKGEYTALLWAVKHPLKNIGSGNPFGIRAAA
ncbi:hypothetical protein CH238_03785 [[Clostridium] leptum DSM 753]|jgi:hypothetical protein|uniref:Uncharacterized protein n=1 Tax=[Clostridium] leptum DSM 753 TaxID=428125 RepID=A0A855A7E1_9FIRM|nr:hypothetical protein CH238_03785 [[Clostridium] leptum DSM 753]